MPRTFGGDTFDPTLDEERLRKQLALVWRIMFDGQWRTLAQLSREADGAPEASVSARLRDFRKAKFGGHTVERQRIPNGNGLHRYRLIPRKAEQESDSYTNQPTLI
jgi:hypothetical protein